MFMAEQVQYITNEHGEQVGVILDISVYRRLTHSETDPELLLNLSHDELVALSQSSLTSNAQNRLDELLNRQSKSELLPEEIAELDELISQVDQLTILKTRARYTLNYLAALPQVS